MKDFNFFEPLTESKSSRKLRDQKWILKGVIFASGAAMLAFPLYNFISTAIIKHEISQYNTILNRPDSRLKISEIESKQKELAALQAENEKTKKINEELDESDNIGGNIVATISGAVPADVFMNSISIEESGITIDGTAKDKEGVAVFQNNLRTLPYFEKVFVPIIDAEEGFNKFTLAMVLKQQEEKDEKAD